MAEPVSQPRYMPFRAAFKGPLCSGQKTATSRSERYGWAGETLPTPYGSIVLRDVYQQTLGKVRATLWREEGCESPEDFERVWRILHRGHFDPLKIVWVHRFRLAL